MLDAVLRRRAEPATAAAAMRLSVWGVQPAALTLAAFLCAAVAMVDTAHGHFWLALALLLAARLFDSLDGPLARLKGATQQGAVLDFVLDLIASAGIPFAFALAQPDRALAAMFLMLGLVARAGAATSTARTGGALGAAGQLVDKTVLFVAFALACLFPGWFSIIAYAIGIACFVGAGSRLAALFAEPA